MRALLVICAALTICAAVKGGDTKPKNKLEEGVLKLLTKWRNGDKGPFSCPLPSLEEIKMPGMSGKYEGFGVKLSYGTSELKATGLETFVVEELNTSESNLTATGKITVPTLTVSADNYEIRTKILLFIPSNGSGKLSITLRNIKMTFSIKLRNLGSQMSVDFLELAFQTSNFEVYLSDGPGLIQSLMNQYGLSTLQNNHKAMVSEARALVVPAIDVCLQNMTPDQLFSTIKGEKTPPVVVQV